MARARIRSAVRIIIAVVVFFVVGLLMLNPTYLVAYTKPSGMMALSVVICDVWHFLSDVATLGSLYYLAAFHRSPYV